MYRRRKDKAWLRRSKEVARIWKSNLSSVDGHFPIEVLCTEIDELKLRGKKKLLGRHWPLAVVLGKVEVRYLVGREESHPTKCPALIDWWSSLDPCKMQIFIVPQIG